MSNIVFLSLIIVSYCLPSWGQHDFKLKVRESVDELQKLYRTNGEAKIDRMGKVSGKDAPLMFFGTKKVNEEFEIVDYIAQKYGVSAIVFVKSGSEYIRVSSSNMMDDGEHRAVGARLSHGAAYSAISRGKPFYGQVDVLGFIHETAFVPIKDANGQVIGILQTEIRLPRQGVPADPVPRAQ